MNDYDPVNKITMKNMSNLSHKINVAQDRMLTKIPAKYRELALLYAELALCQQGIDQHLDRNEVLMFEDYHQIKDLVQTANEKAAEIKQFLPDELREAATAMWDMVKSKDEPLAEVSK